MTDTPARIAEAGRAGPESAMKIRRALISVWDKSGVVELASALAAQGAEILSTGGTAQALREAKLRTMGRNPEYAKPYYWSSLVLVGQWR